MGGYNGSQRLSDLAVRFHSDLAAVLEHSTRRALGQGTGTDVLAEWNQQTIDLDPVAPRQLLFELPPDLLGASRLHVPPTNGHASDVDVDADSLMTCRDSECEVGALRSHAIELHEDFGIGRQVASELIDRRHRDGADLSRFGLVECARRDELIDLLFAQLRDGARIRRRLK